VTVKPFVAHAALFCGHLAATAPRTELCAIAPRVKQGLQEFSLSLVAHVCPLLSY